MLAPQLHRYVVPASLVVLVGLFLSQSHGTGKVGASRTLLAVRFREQVGCQSEAVFSKAFRRITGRAPGGGWCLAQPRRQPRGGRGSLRP